MKKLFTCLLIMALATSTFSVFAEEPMTLKRGLHFEMTFEEAAETVGGISKYYYTDDGIPYFQFEDTVAGRKDVWVTVLPDEQGGIHSIHYEFDSWNNAYDVDTQAYRETERMLEDKYGVSIYSDNTARMLPFPAEKINSSFAYEYHAYTMTSLIGEEYNYANNRRYVWECPEYSQWVIKDGDHYIVIEHSLMIWKTYMIGTSELTYDKYNRVSVCA